MRRTSDAQRVVRRPDPRVTGRAHALERLQTEPLDVLIVGGGIIGAGIAEIAARHGLRVAVVERDDFASGTSSASSKLIHGGLRYLRLGHFSLVREALAEVHALSRIVAPHLVRPLNFVLPVYRGGPYGRIPIRGALWSYAGLTGAVSERGRMISPAAASKLVPALRRDGLRAAGLYPDSQTDDARLCLANLRAAADVGRARGGAAPRRAGGGRGRAAAAAPPPPPPPLPPPPGGGGGVLGVGGP